MDSKLLIDSLTSHISLYHSSSKLQSQVSTSSQNPRTSILRWFSSLSTHQRQSSLTIVDSNFLEIIIDMQTKLHKHGHGNFIILPDLPSCNQPFLPSLCFRKSNGLLARVSVSNESERSIYESVQLFGSEDEQKIDSLTVCEDLVRDYDRFVGIMDGVSNGGFLRGEESILGSDWEELFWLKDRGYYSLEAFIANKLELALRLSWLNSSNGSKKKGAKLKEKASVAGIAANVYWRKKGCLDWWAALDPGTRKKLFCTVLGKAAKSLTKESLKAKNSYLDVEKCLFSTEAKQPRRYSSTSSFRSAFLAASAADVGFCSSILSASTSGQQISSSSIFISLYALQEICTMILAFKHTEYDREKLLFSSLGSLHTISDYVLRKFRGRLMAVSSNCIKLELLGEPNVNLPLNKSKDNHSVGKRRGKGRSHNLKKINSVPKSPGANHVLEKSLKDHGLACKEAANLKVEVTIDTPNGLNFQKETSVSRVELDHAKGWVDGKVQSMVKKSRKKNTKRKTSSLIESVTPSDTKVRSTAAASQSVSLQSDAAKADWFPCDLTVCNLEKGLSVGSDSFVPITHHETSMSKPVKDDAEETRNSVEDPVVNFISSSHHLGCFDLSSGGGREASDCSYVSEMIPPDIPGLKSDTDICETELKNAKSENVSDVASQGASSSRSAKTANLNEENFLFQRPEVGNTYARWPKSSLGNTSYEWPSVARFNIPFVNSHHMPAATDRLHLDVGGNWRNNFHQPFVSTRHQAISPSIEGGCSRLMPRTLPVSFDWPPMVRSASRLTPSMTCNYDSGFIPRIQSTYHQGLTPRRLQPNGALSDEERKYSGEAMDSWDFMTAAEVADGDPHWVSEEEYELHAISGRDYNQYFGGGVMFWNSSEHGGTSCSRPPSLSSEDSSWAWHEADLNRAIDDMVGFPSTYSSNGLTSPPSGPFCSPFDPLGPGHQTLGYALPGNDVIGKVNHPLASQSDGVPDEKISGSFTDSSGSVGERQNTDLLSYPILRPIIIPNLSRKGSRSEFKVSHDHKSPCVPHTRREQPRIKRPPSPMVLCVPRAPCPPPFSPVIDSRKRRGFSTVRSGSSSPRHLGMRSWYHDGNNPEEANFCVEGAEVVWPSWRSKGLSATSMIQPLPGALLEDHLISISQMSLDQEHPDAAFPLQPPELLNCPSRKASLPLMHSFLHDEIDFFCKQVAAKNIIMKPCISWAVKRVARSLQVLWPRSRTNIFGSNATGLSLPTSDVDLVVCLPPVRNLEPIKEAGILEGRNGIKETCLQHAARYLANQEWVKNDSLKTVENTAIPIIMLVVEVPQDVVISCGNTSNELTPKLKSIEANSEESSSDHSDTTILEDSSWKICSEVRIEEGLGVKSVRLDISFKSPSHTGLQTTELVRELTEQFPAATPLALVLKQFLADRSLDHSYSGGLSSYCLVLLITRFLQHEHHLGRPINQNLGSLFMDFLYFFGNVFDPRQMRISIQGSGVYANRERGHSIDPIHIDDPLFPTNNVGKNCFRIHQCIKAFADAYSILENELGCLPCTDDQTSSPSYRLLQKVIPSIVHV
ncbi:Non-canonical poly(A) RNA polymerase protein Trf4-1 [Thalictrum thalictroides]|uniref:Non-canonical poly(A) RNA polymerase protein Trf4-1 n=1 Tax=Thalictrum thalictroides TaxID=46969 RepID=A0A7J6V627_THATH|nr:Non-canonical poly(A) RNA polymerase protein Trf4-1 [Thalictrum thalictroides]